jgi:hypothetical protein
MRSLKVVGILVCVLALGSMALAGGRGNDRSMGIRDVSRVTFVAPIRVGGALLPAGDYLVRHTMEGQDHVMVFESVKGKAPETKVKCNLVRLTQKADENRIIYQMNAANERVLQELVFRGDTAKHVF